MPDAFEVLRADHAAVEQMLTALENSPGHSAGAGSTVLAARKEVAQRLVIDSSQHEAAEEQYFWPAVRQRLAPGRPQPLGDVAAAPAPDPFLYATYNGAMGEPGGPAMGTETGLTGKIKNALS